MCMKQLSVKKVLNKRLTYIDVIKLLNTHPLTRKKNQFSNTLWYCAEPLIHSVFFNRCFTLNLKKDWPIFYKHHGDAECMTHDGYKDPAIIAIGNMAKWFKQEVLPPHGSPDKTVQINKHIWLYHNVDEEKNKWDLMMSGPASLAVISFIKNWRKKLRLLVDLRIFSKFQGA